MNYKKIYDALVNKAKVRGLDKSSVGYYTEIHHIVPRCLGGSDTPDNLVMFTGREHYIAHMLLWKSFPSNISLMRAAHIMSSRWVNATVGGQGCGINSKTYQRLREEYALAVKAQVSGKGNPFYGKTHDQVSLDKMRKGRLAHKIKQKLKNWRDNNAAYMAQFDFSHYPAPASVETVDCCIPPFRMKGELSDWLG